MKSLVTGLAGAGLATLLALSGPAFAQEETETDAPAAAEQDSMEAEGDGADAAPDAMAGEEAVPTGPSPEIQTMMDGIEGDADRALWCASAFALLGSVSENPAEQQGLTQLSQGLIATARDQLPESEYSEEDFAAIAAGYNLTVLNQFEAQDETAMPYSPDDCFAAAEVPEAAPGGGASQEAPQEAPAEGDTPETMDDGAMADDGAEGEGEAD